MNLFYRELDDLIVLVHGARLPADGEWQQYVSLFEERARAGRLADAKVLVWTNGTGPNAKQRSRLNELTRSGGVRTAVVGLEPAIARGIVTAFSWFNPSIRFFGPEGLEEGFDHLELAETQRARASTVLQALRDEAAQSFQP